MIMHIYVRCPHECPFWWNELLKTFITYHKCFETVEAPAMASHALMYLGLCVCVCMRLLRTQFSRPTKAEWNGCAVGTNSDTNYAHRTHTGLCDLCAV